MDLGIEGDSALVTASSSGLGKASATALAREGVDVVINGRDEDRLAEAKAEVEAVAAGSVLTQQGDLTEKSDIEAIVERPVEAFGGLDHLVTSAGGPPSGAFSEMADEDWYEAFDLLVMSVVRLVRNAEPQRGHHHQHHLSQRQGGPGLAGTVELGPDERHRPGEDPLAGAGPRNPV
jgi:3-oxoacyl-[acyl-carrier protein] reductase